MATVELTPGEHVDLEWLRGSTAAALTLRQTAQVLDLDPRTVSDGVKRGEIPAIKIGRRILIPREPLLAMLTSPTGPAS